MRNILILGGTMEASALARALAERGEQATLSYAGRTGNPRAQPVPIRVGGFGGADGLAAFLKAGAFTHLVDATHPFAAAISANAAAAARASDVAHLMLTRPEWQAVDGDRWTHVPDIASAVRALDGPPRRVMLALGRMHVEAFAAQPQHQYLLRFVDAPDAPPTLLRHHLLVDRGPFTPAGDLALMRDHGIDLVVAKNAGGEGARAKIDAARALGLPVIMIDRPPMPQARAVHDIGDVLAWIDHSAHRGV
ncbi:cobalt-precorrin-6A reductase [Sphingomonadales bacterium 56]|uniref:cobalt-precorrin-6A reductase n=1 Tax=unclassified Sphingobium TaxID=2611147 RepID=UPI001918B444|nr:MULTISPECIES: cobalt-precorrin-6A reductase [unclassified Sphingobium]MBY2930597.1 cobalt-precorrin-6A reductase [Sphingomonadales bacterium 56]MBY2960567.1 cobalt-precorrin-6A reductase [Sphingomonadales bacterium 58]